MNARFAALQPHAGPIRSATYLSASPETVLWGRLPCEADRPVLTVEPGTDVTIDTVSHEGLLEDQGRDPVGFFGPYGVDAVLSDAIAIDGNVAGEAFRARAVDDCAASDDDIMHR